MPDKWLPIKEYHLAYIDGDWYVLRDGGEWVQSHVKENEKSLRVVAEVPNRDVGLSVLRALRDTLEEEG